MPIPPDHGSDRNGNGKSGPTGHQFKATDAKPIVEKVSKATHRQTSSETLSSKKVEVKESQPMTDRQYAVTKLDLTSPKDLRRLRDLLAPEYDTLAKLQEQLLQASRGQYVLIHEQEVRIHADLDSALEEAYTNYPLDLFFVGHIHERDFQEYLKTYGA